MSERKLHLFFSHKLTTNQEEEIFGKLGCEKVVKLPEELLSQWSQIKPEGEITILLKPFLEYLKEETSEKDYVLVQGEFGVSFAVVSWCLKNERIPVYATTRRVVEETKQVDGSIKKINIFKHIQFRRYVL
ncbi:MAG: CRISPR-associated protein Csx20 [Candidatus Stygibacter australis]|nr:CRISPR-associated protein Csx20 [Candidatus Stygibacter australis]